jgi:hypothetical protein
MTTMVHTNLLSQFLRLIPGRIHTALDAWSYRVAVKHAKRRRLAVEARKNRAAALKQLQIPLTDFPA